MAWCGIDGAAWSIGRRTIGQTAVVHAADGRLTGTEKPGRMAGVRSDP